MSFRRALTSLAIAAGLIAALPSGASAGESCLFQKERATELNQSQLESSLLCLTNVYRLHKGRAALRLDTRLAKAARAHSLDMVLRGYLDHFTPEGIGPDVRAVEAGYRGRIGENVARNGDGTVATLFEFWRGSPDHNRNMLDPRFKAAGFGVKRGCCPIAPDGVTGTQMFGFSAANSGSTGLDLYASSAGCARAKLAVINGRRRIKTSTGSARRRLERRIRNAHKRSGRICQPPA